MKAIIMLLECVCVSVKRTQAANHTKQKRKNRQKQNFLVTSPLRDGRTLLLLRITCAKYARSSHIELRALERGYLQQIFMLMRDNGCKKGTT
jgi:hypothetical protein